MNRKVSFHVISLKNDQARREIFFKQSEAFRFSVNFAIDGSKFTEKEVEDSFDVKQFFSKYGRNVLSGEIGCTLSHVKLWREVLNSKCEYFVIAEDDAIFSKEFKNDMESLLNHPNLPDFILLSRAKFFSFSTKANDLIFPISLRVFSEKINQHLHLGRLYKTSTYGTCLYFISKKGIEKILAKSQKPFWLADDLALYEELGLNVQFTNRLFAIENPRLNSRIRREMKSIVLKKNIWKHVVMYLPFKTLATIRQLLKL